MRPIAGQLDRYRTAEFSLEELAAAAGRLLRHMAVRPADGRVAATPDRRGIRFYQTAGVLDRPLRYDGRRAVYGFRHLVQLLTVKRLQHEGRPLALIRRQLAGLQTSELELALDSGRAGDVAGARRTPRLPDAAPEARSLIAADLAPGITVTIDPARVGDGASILARLRELFRRTDDGG